jgi:hypothetical protein
LLLEETNKYYQQYLDTLDKGCSHCKLWLLGKCICFYLLLYTIRGTHWNPTGAHQKSFLCPSVETLKWDILLYTEISAL